MPVAVECIEVVQRFGAHVVLDGVSWSLPAGAVAGLLGASGAGKTSLLRVLAGLDRPVSGRVSYSAADGPGKPVAAVAIGMVFQNLALWPHLTARRHVECVLARLPRRERRPAAETVLSEVRLPSTAWDRRPAELSGGEAQRLALARALAPHPELLLLDEPLAQLDFSLRAELLALIQELAQARGTTVIYVTHSWAEVLEICDRAAVLVAGRIAQAGPLEEVFRSPATAAIARLTGPVCEIPCSCVADGAVTIDGQADLLRDGDASRFVVRPQQMRLEAALDGQGWRVTDCRPSGAGWRVALERSREKLRVESPEHYDTGQFLLVHVTGDLAARLELQTAASLPAGD